MLKETHHALQSSHAFSHSQWKHSHQHLIQCYCQHWGDHTIDNCSNFSCSKVFVHSLNTHTIVLCSVRNMLSSKCVITGWVDQWSYDKTTWRNCLCESCSFSCLVALSLSEVPSCCLVLADMGTGIRLVGEATLTFCKRDLNQTRNKNKGTQNVVYWKVCKK